jgi:dUTP pyrophosphatase
MILKIKKLHNDAKIPRYAYAGDAGMDLFCVENHLIKSQERLNIPTGIAMEIPKGHVGLIWDKSGLAAKNGIHCLAGVIDSGYRGEIILTLLNTSKNDYKIKKGDKICQLLIQEIFQPKIKLVQKLTNTDRGIKKHGSSGK